MLLRMLNWLIEWGEKWNYVYIYIYIYIYCEDIWIVIEYENCVAMDDLNKIYDLWCEVRYDYLMWIVHAYMD